MVPLCSECPCNRFRQEKRRIPIYNGRYEIGASLYRPVGYRGDAKSGFLTVGESPGAHENQQGKAFVGDSGKVYADALSSTKIIKPSQTFLANSCQCVLIKKELSQKEINQAMACCRPALIDAIQRIKPKIILCLGDIALKQILPKIKGGITKNRGKVFDSEEFGCRVLPTFHPAYILRSPNHKRYFLPDIKRAAELWSGKDIQKQTQKVTYSDVNSIQFILDQKDITVSLDTEGQGLRWWVKPYICISYSIGLSDHEGYNIWLMREAIPEQNKTKNKKRNLKIDKEKDVSFYIIQQERDGELQDIYVKKEPDFDQKIVELKELLSRKDIKKVMMHGNFDLHVFESLGIDVSQIENYTADVQSMSHEIDPDVFKTPSLSNIQSAFAPHLSDQKSQLQSDMNMADMLNEAKKNPEKFTEYSCNDGRVTAGLYPILKKELIQDRLLSRYYARFVHPVTTKVLYDIEKNGVLIDRKKLPEAIETVKNLIETRHQEALSLVPKKVVEYHTGKKLPKLSQSNFLRDVLFSKSGFGLPELKIKEARTATGLQATGKDILARMREELDIKSIPSKFIERYLSWKPLTKLLSTYLLSYEKLMDKNGYVYPSISLLGTSTDRTSMSNPNFQNVPKHNKEISQIVRSLITCPEGWKIGTVDYSQSELRWIAFRSGDKTFILLFKEGKDIHYNTARETLLLSGLQREVTDKDRNDAKSLNFGYAYGMHPKGFVVWAKDKYGAEFSLKQATDHREHYFKTYDGLLPWHRNEIAFAQKHGYCRSPFGFRRMLPHINNHSDFMARSQDERNAINTPIQNASNAAALLSALMGKEQGIIDDNFKIFWFVHDELGFIGKEEVFEDRMKKIMNIMRNIDTKRFGFELDIPLEVDPKDGYNLGSLSKME